MKAFHYGVLGVCATLMPLGELSYAAEADAPKDVEEVIVTGSYIKGSAEDAALPIDVVTAEDLQAQGNPSMIEFIRQLGVTAGNLAETNQFTVPAQGTEGTTTINLRGLGGGRTLTMINGHRHVATENNGVDVSAFPQAVFARTEILKDGAAALYGSDAIAGVVNFITREGFEGIEVSGSNSWIEDTSASNASILAGWAGDRLSGFAAFEWDYRDELQIRDRDWGIKPFAQNLAGGWSSTGMPGTLYLLDPNIRPTDPTKNNKQSFRGPDPQCEQLGGEVLFGTCNFQFSFFDNLVEETDVYKTYGELNYDLTDSAKVHVEGLYSYLDMPEWKSSPAYPPNSLFGADRVVPATNPGLIQFKQDYPEMFAVLPAGTTIDTVEAYMRSRMLGVNGRNGDPLSAYIEAQTYRLGASLTGEMTENVNYSFGATWSKRKREANGYDMQVQGMAFALNGLGGEGCTPGGANAATSTPGVGPCQWFNPFSEAIERSAVTGPNPTFVPAVANSKELIEWLTLEGVGRQTNELLVFDLVFDGELGILSLPGGAIGWALGAQTRNEVYETELSTISNRAESPCPWTNPFAVTLGFVTADQLSPNCNPKNGLVAFGVPGDEADESRTVYAVFAELALPVTETLDMQAALRFEDYGSEGGSTIDPKFAVKWQALEWLAFRGSVSSTFRGPSLSYLSGVNTFLQNIPAANAYRAVNIIGNDDLEPESALATSAGIIVQAGGFTATIDYWKFDFQDPFQIESAGQILTAYETNGCFDGGAGAPVGGAISAICEELRPRIEPTGSVAANLAAVNTFFINGSDIDTDGVDVYAAYAFDLGFGQITVGAEGTYTNKYESDDFESLDGTVLAPGGDFVDKTNISNNPFYPLPDLKGNAFIRYATDVWQLGYTLRYVSEYEDNTPFLGAFHPYLVDIEAMTTHDVTAVYTWNDLIVSASVYNLTDEEPPPVFAAQEYDPYTHNPLGRIVKLQLTYSIGGG